MKFFVLVAYLQIGAFLNLSKKVGRNCAFFPLCFVRYLISGEAGGPLVMVLVGVHQAPRVLPAFPGAPRFCGSLGNALPPGERWTPFHAPWGQPVIPAVPCLPGVPLILYS